MKRVKVVVEIDYPDVFVDQYGGQFGSLKAIMQIVDQSLRYSSYSGPPIAEKYSFDIKSIELLPDKRALPSIEDKREIG